MVPIKFEKGVLALFCCISFILHTLCQDPEGKMSSKQIQSRKVNQGLNLRYEKLMKAAMRNPVVHLKTREEVQEFVLNSSRNYSLVLFVNVHPEVECKTCTQVLNALRSIAQSYINQKPKDMKIFFIQITQRSSDIEDPSLFYVLPGEKLENSNQMKNLVYGNSEENIKRWIRSAGEQDMPLEEEPGFNNSYMYLYALFGIYSIYKHRLRLMTLYESDLRRNITVGVIGLILLFTSGQVFNHIEGIPFTLYNYGGSVWIYPSTHMQLVLESFIVLGLSAVNVFGFIIMLENGPKRNELSCSTNSTMLGLTLFMLRFFAIQFIGHLKLHS